MLVNAITYKFLADDADKAEQLLHNLRDASLAEAGCKRFDVARGNDDASVFVLYEEYTDRAALDAHLATDHFKQYGLNGVRLLAKERVAHLCHPID
jgi:quinol monooxygenase YgiN